MRTVNFLLIKNLCIVDFVGAVVVLPVPLVATVKGQWDFGHTICTANSIVNVALWFQHIVMFAMLKIDRVLASCLPFGKYPLLSVEVVTGIIISTWVFSFFVAGLVTSLFKSSYEPAVVLCIPELPIGFFITIFSVYCLVLFGMVAGYILVLICLRKKQAQIQNANSVQSTDYKGLERAALTSFLITISHFLLYVPTMLVIGLHGWFLHPVAILICDMVVYSEFLIHPVVLLSTSTKLRREIKHTLYRLWHDITSLWLTEIGWCTKRLLGCSQTNKKDQIYAVRRVEADRNHNSSFGVTEDSIGSGPPVKYTTNGDSSKALFVSNNTSSNMIKNHINRGGGHNKELTSVVIHDEARSKKPEEVTEDDDDVVIDLPALSDAAGKDAGDTTKFAASSSNTSLRYGGRSLSRDASSFHKGQQQRGGPVRQRSLDQIEMGNKNSKMLIKRHSISTNIIKESSFSPVASSASSNNQSEANIISCNGEIIMRLGDEKILAQKIRSQETAEAASEAASFLYKHAIYSLPTKAFIPRMTDEAKQTVENETAAAGRNHIAKPTGCDIVIREEQGSLDSIELTFIQPKKDLDQNVDHEKSSLDKADVFM
jgi:hypothetical protein